MVGQVGQDTADCILAKRGQKRGGEGDESDQILCAALELLEINALSSQIDEDAVEGHLGLQLHRVAHRAVPFSGDGQLNAGPAKNTAFFGIWTPVANPPRY